MAAHLVLGANEYLDAFPLLGGGDLLQQALPRLQRIEEAADALQVLDRGHVVEEPRLPLDDQGPRAAAAGPDGEPALDDPLRQLVERRAVLLQLATDRAARVVQGASDHARLEVVG